MDFWDYTVLLLILAFISGFGLWKRTPTTGNVQRDVLIGSGMSVGAVALSVCSTFISSVSLLGFPAEVYYFGVMIVWYSVAYFIAFPIVAELFLPKLFAIKSHSIYEYLGTRFCKRCKYVGLFVFFLQTLLYNAVVLYVPAMAVSTTTGFPLVASISFTAFLSAVYISVGGAKAGIHTSAMQMVLIVLTMIIIVIINLTQHPLGEVFVIARKHSRLDIADFRMDPRVRHSVFSVTIGGICNILSLFAANQLSVQRFMAMPTLKDAKKVVYLNIKCNLLMLISYVFAGLLIFARYFDCDPQLKNINELFPRFVLDSFTHLSGTTGLFTAAVFSAGISTLSSSFSALSTVLLNDVIKTTYRSPISDEKALLITKIIPFVLAIVTAFLAWICQYLNNLALQIAFTVFGVVGGPVLGTFTIGFFIPRIKGMSGVVGLVTSLLFCSSIAMGALFNQVKPIPLPLGSECRMDFTNSTLSHDNYGRVLPLDSSSVWVNITQISYQYYGLVGILVNIFAASACQFLFGSRMKNDPRGEALPSAVYPNDLEISKANDVCTSLL